MNIWTLQASCIAPDKAIFHPQSINFFFLNFIFFYLSMKPRCGYPSEAPNRGASDEYPQHMVLRNKKKIFEYILLSGAMQ